MLAGRLCRSVMGAAANIPFYIMMAWEDGMVSIVDEYVFACYVDGLPVRGRKRLHVDGVPVLLVACESGIYAVEDKCPQTGRSIAHGKVLDCTIVTPTNGARYDLVTGRYLGGGQSWFQSHWLTTFPVQVVNGEVRVKLRR